MIVLWIIIGIILAVFAASMFCIAPGRMTMAAKRTSEAFSGLNCAHRGLYTEDQTVPENSLPAFAAARDSGYGVELDAQLSSDGQVIVFHDDDLKRVCDVDKPVNTLAWEELRLLRLFGGAERIPLLSEVLDELGETPVIVELKSAGANNPLLCQKTYEVLQDRGKCWCIESFDPRVVAWFRGNCPDILRGQLGDRPRSYETQPKATAFLLGNLLTNFISRPNFIAYSTQSRPITVRLCMAFRPMKVVWTVHPEHDTDLLEKDNDTVIFEYYTPKPRFR